MKLLLHPHHHHEHPWRMDHPHGKKGRRIMKKMAKLEKKFNKYGFNNIALSDSDSSTSSDSTSRSRSHSRCKNKHGRRGHHKHGKRFASHHRGSSSSSSSNDSSSDSSSSSSKSPSPPGHRGHHGHHGPHGPHGHHHHGSPRQLLRSQSFSGRSCSPPFARGHSHHRHGPPHGPPHHRGHHHSPPPPPPHHRGRYWRHHHSRRFDDGPHGRYILLAQSEPNLDQEASQERQNGERSEAPIDENAPEQMEQEVQEVNAENQGQQNEAAAEGPEINSALADQWTEVLQNGLSADAKKKLLDKYPVSRNCSLLRGPKMNEEILPVATGAALNRDALQLHEQNQIGTGLTALGQAITDLNNKPELKNDQEVVSILDALNEAATIILDAHHNITKTRQAVLLPELKKGARAVVQTCKANEYLYGKDFGEKVKDLKVFKKAAKGKGGKRKYAEFNGEERKSKRLGRDFKKH